MRDALSLLGPDERLTLALRRLYEGYGYRQFRMNRFEEYDFYAPYRDYLAGGQVLTFTDLNGRLMALRPDVTLSIVKKARGGAAAEKLYYAESVYRPSRGGGFGEGFQIGIECIGRIGAYTTLETVMLAVMSLEAISPRYVLDVSHTGFVSGLLGGLDVDAALKAALRRCIEEKNAHGIAQLAGDRLGPHDAQRLIRACRIQGPLGEVLGEAQALADNGPMRQAVQALAALAASLAAVGGERAVRLDFSICSDAKYYSGLMLRGYIDGVPTAVLSGGRYDPLLRRMGKPGEAIGFAVYLGELLRYLAPDAATDAGETLAYAQDADPAAVFARVRARAERGERVLAVPMAKEVD